MAQSVGLVVEEIRVTMKYWQSNGQWPFESRWTFKAQVVSLPDLEWLGHKLIEENQLQHHAFYLFIDHESEPLSSDSTPERISELAKYSGAVCLKLQYVRPPPRRELPLAVLGAFSTAPTTWAPTLPCSTSRSTSSLVPSPRSRYPLICVEGIICCGKTTFLNQLEAFSGAASYVEMVREPMEAVFDGLDDLYSAFAAADILPEHQAQTAALEDQFFSHHHRTAEKSRISCPLFTERSLLSTMEIFVPPLLEKGLLTEEACAKLQARYDAVKQDKHCEPDFYIHIRTPAEAAHKRIPERIVKEPRYEREENIPIDYMHEHERKYIEIFQRREFEGRVFVLDGNQPPEDMRTELLEKVRGAVKDPRNPRSTEAKLLLHCLEELLSSTFVPPELCG